MPTSYFVYPARLAYLPYVRSLVALLCGGCPIAAGHRLVLVAVTACNAETQQADHAEAQQVMDEVKALTADYIQLRQQLNGFYKGSLFATEMAVPELVADSSGTRPAAERSALCPPQLVAWQHPLRGSLLSRAVATDRIVVLATNPADMGLAAALRSLPGLAADCMVGAVCQLPPSCVSQDSVVHPLAASLDFLREACTNVVVTGRRSDTQKQAFTTMQTVAAVADLLYGPVSGEPQVLGLASGFSYTPENLSSAILPGLLQRLWLLHALREEADSKSLKPWRDHTQAKSMAFWTQPPLFDRLGRLVDNIQRVLSTLSQAGDFSIHADKAQLGDVVTAMNQVAPLPAAATRDERRQARITSLLQAVEAAVSLAAPQPGTYQQPESSYVDLAADDTDGLFALDNVQQALSPTALLEVTDHAFQARYAADHAAKRWRSACLNLWTLFFKLDRSQLEGQVSVSEVALPAQPTDQRYALLPLSRVGRRIVDESLFYEITGAVVGGYACTSPLTGFACQPDAQTAVADLWERPKDFQQFLYVYLAMYPHHFSDTFRQYVEQALRAHKAETDALGHNIISRYPRFRQHVGIDVG